MYGPIWALYAFIWYRIWFKYFFSCLSPLLNAIHRIIWISPKQKKAERTRRNEDKAKRNKKKTVSTKTVADEGSLRGQYATKHNLNEIFC